MRKKLFKRKGLLRTVCSTLVAGNIFFASLAGVSAGAMIGSSNYNDFNSALQNAVDDNTIVLTSDDSSTAGHINFSYGTLTITSTAGNTWTISDRNVLLNSGQGGGAVMSFNNTMNRQLTLRNINFINNTIGSNYDNPGGVILVGANVANFTINGENSIFRNNKVLASSGSVVYAEHVLNFNMNNSIFDSNQAINGSGAIFGGEGLNFGGNNNTFTNNKSDFGGAALSTNEILTLSGSNNNFTGNLAGYSGGAISSDSTNITGSNNSFTGNSASSGGAINAGGLAGVTISGNNTTFTNNTATNNGGAIYTWGDVTISGNNTYFNGNTAGGNLNSIHLYAYANVHTLNVSSSGNTLMYDPISSEDGGNGGKIAINQTGTGVWTLGGNNQIHDGNWDISAGTLLLTYDSAGNMAQINNLGAANTFTLGSAATLLVVPDPSGAMAQINSTTVDLQGTVGVGSDLRTASEGSLGDRVLLRLSEGNNNALRLTGTSGKFSLGLHDYAYDNLHWENSNRDLVLNVHNVVVNPDRSGGHSITTPVATNLNNMSNTAMFMHMSSIFDKVREGDQDFFYDYQTNTRRNLWGHTYFNRTQKDQDGRYSGYSVKTPGIILGNDWQLGKNSFLGLALSGAWPKFEQGSTEVKGHDIRFNIYGGSALANDWEFAYLLGAGLNDYDGSRHLLGNRYEADFKGKNYSAGIYLGKVFRQSANAVLKPFVTYEYMRMTTDGYSEKGDGGANIATSSHAENISRMRLGVEWKKQMSQKNHVSASVFWQRLFGDINPYGTSWLVSSPQYPVRTGGGALDRNSAGLDLSWGRQLNQKSKISLTYRGLYGSKGLSTEFDFMYSYSF